jgi:hypothetical protein
MEATDRMVATEEKALKGKTRLTRNQFKKDLKHVWSVESPTNGLIKMDLSDSIKFGKHLVLLILRCLKRIELLDKWESKEEMVEKEEQGVCQVIQELYK